MAKRICPNDCHSVGNSIFCDDCGAATVPEVVPGSYPTPTAHSDDTVSASAHTLGVRSKLSRFRWLLITALVLGVVQLGSLGWEYYKTHNQWFRQGYDAANTATAEQGIYAGVAPLGHCMNISTLARISGANDRQAALVFDGCTAGLRDRLGSDYDHFNRMPSAGLDDPQNSSGATADDAPTKPTAPPAAATSRLAGMIVFLDPTGGGGDSATLSQKVPDGRGGTARCQPPAVATADGYPGHTFVWDTTLRIRQALNALGVRTAMSRGNDDQRSPCSDERAAMSNAVEPNAFVGIGVYSLEMDSGFAVQYPKPSLNAAHNASHSLAEMMRDQLNAAGLQLLSLPGGAAGLNGVSSVPELNLAHYPAVKVLLGSVSSPSDAQQMHTPAGRQRYADAVVKGIVAFLQTQPPRR